GGPLLGDRLRGAGHAAAHRVLHRDGGHRPLALRGFRGREHPDRRGRPILRPLPGAAVHRRVVLGDRHVAPHVSRRDRYRPEAGGRDIRNRSAIAVSLSAIPAILRHPPPSRRKTADFPRMPSPPPLFGRFLCAPLPFPTRPVQSRSRGATATPRTARPFRGPARGPLTGFPARPAPASSKAARRPPRGAPWLHRPVRHRSPVQARGPGTG